MSIDHPKYLFISQNEKTNQQTKTKNKLVHHHLASLEFKVEC